MPPKYKGLYLDDEQMKNSIHLQVLARHNPKRINWPPEPWCPISGLGLILKEIRSKWA